MDSLYFNARAPLSNGSEKRVWPEVVTKALTKNTNDEEKDEDDSLIRPKISQGQLSNLRRVSSDLGTPMDTSSSSVVYPKDKNQITGGARPKKSRTNPSRSIVGKYLGNDTNDVDMTNGPKKLSKKRRAPQAPLTNGMKGEEEDEVAVGKLVSLSPEPDFAFGARRRVSYEETEEEEPPWRKLLREAEKRTREEMEWEKKKSEEEAKNQRLQNGRMMPNKHQDQHKPINRDHHRVHRGEEDNHKFNGGQDSHKFNRGNVNKYVEDHDSSVQMLPPPKLRQKMTTAQSSSSNGTSSKEPSEQGMAERERLREMLSGLRKDPFDEDLEDCDGKFFPCEFCGDPYPSEFIMRHQLSCDLNPNPVTSGQGFDYAVIRSRAEANMLLSKQADQIKF